MRSRYKRLPRPRVSATSQNPPDSQINWRLIHNRISSPEATLNQTPLGSPAFSSTVWFSEKPNFIKGPARDNNVQPKTMRLVAEVVDKFSGALKEMQKNLHELSKERMRAAPRPRKS
jgi:hypothetical protein